MLVRLSGWILKILGWTVSADRPEARQFVVIAAPHTSNWDFPLGILAAKAMNLEISWMGKHSLFRWPLGWFFKWIGGIPIKRGHGLNYIAQMANMFEHTPDLVLALAPEGTRSKTDHWKTGFHYIARAANVPIVLGYLDFAKKRVGIGGAFMPTNDIEADFEIIRSYFQGITGKHPEKESQIKVKTKP